MKTDAIEELFSLASKLKHLCAGGGPIYRAAATIDTAKHKINSLRIELPHYSEATAIKELADRAKTALLADMMEELEEQRANNLTAIMEQIEGIRCNIISAATAAIAEAGQAAEKIRGMIDTPLTRAD